jgi:hypothetical protein
MKNRQSKSSKILPKPQQGRLPDQVSEPAAPEVIVKSYTAPPKGPEEKQIHPRLKLPAVPDAPQPKTSDEKR